MTKKTSDSDTRDLYENLPKRFDHFIIDRAGTADDPVLPEDHGQVAKGLRRRVALGMLSILRPRGRSTAYHHTIQVREPNSKLNFRKAPASVEIHPVLPADVPMALFLLIGEGKTKIDSTIHRAGPPGSKTGMQVDPGWVELYSTNDGVFGAIKSLNGWPSWKEEWYLPDGEQNLASFSGMVLDKPTDYPTPTNFIKWSHEVSALTGSYEGENELGGTWLLVKSGTTKVAVIHQIPITAGSQYVDTWWLSSNFVWWGNGDVPAAVTVVSEANAKSYRAGFNTTTRYKHVVTKVTQA